MDQDTNTILNVKLNTLLSQIGNSPADIGLSAAKYCKYPSQYHTYGGDVEEFEKPFKGVLNRRFLMEQKMCTSNIKLREKNKYHDSPDYKSSVLKWEQDNYDKANRQHPDFICSLGVLKILMSIPASYFKPYCICARKEQLGDGQSIFLYFGINNSQTTNLTGFGLERLVLSETPDGEPIGNEKQYSLSNKLLGVFQTDISMSNNKSCRLHYTAELDGLWSEKEIIEYTCKDIVEVKTINHKDFSRGVSSNQSTSANYHRATIGRSWAHCTLLGADKVMYGLLGSKGHTLKEMRVYEVWTPEKLTNQLYMELQFIYDTVETKGPHTFNYRTDTDGKNIVRQHCPGV